MWQKIRGFELPTFVTIINVLANKLTQLVKQLCVLQFHLPYVSVFSIHLLFNHNQFGQMMAKGVLCPSHYFSTHI
jgi:hypothetical protein